MAYLLEFPPSKLPEGILAPPYVVFGIQGMSVADMLPPRIPLKAVLQFIPKLARFVLPAPESLPPKIAQEALREPRVGLDICLDIGIASLQRIVLKVLQSAGLNVSARAFQSPPTTITSLSICKTWDLFELPLAGLDGLYIHLQTHLMSGPPLHLEEMEALWDTFPPASDMLRAIFVNFIQSHTAWHYSRTEFYTIQTWYQSDDTRYALFKSIQAQFPDFDVREAASKEREVLLAQKAAEDAAAAMAAMEKMVKDSHKRKQVRKPPKMGLEDLGPGTTISKSMGRRLRPAAEMTMKEMTRQLTEALEKMESGREGEGEDGEREEEVLLPTIYDPEKAEVGGFEAEVELH